MPTLGSEMTGSLLPGESVVEGAYTVDTTQVIDELLPDLHADSRANLIWWSNAELIRWMDEGLKRLARRCMVFVGRQGSQVTTPGTAGYGTPDRHIATIHVSYDSVPLRGTSQREQEARDTSYETTAGTPEFWYSDNLGGGTVALAPVPDEAHTLGIVYEGFPAPLDAGGLQTFVSAPAPLKGYIAMTVLGEAYGKEGQAEAPDIAAHCRERVALYEQAFAQYFGKGR